MSTTVTLFQSYASCNNSVLLSLNVGRAERIFSINKIFRLDSVSMWNVQLSNDVFLAILDPFPPPIWRFQPTTTPPPPPPFWGAPARLAPPPPPPPRVIWYLNVPLWGWQLSVGSTNSLWKLKYWAFRLRIRIWTASSKYGTLYKCLMRWWYWWVYRYSLLYIWRCREIGIQI